jgi:hypothetical protein
VCRDGSGASAAHPELQVDRTQVRFHRVDRRQILGDLLDGPQRWEKERQQCVIEGPTPHDHVVEAVFAGQAERGGEIATSVLATHERGLLS